MQRVRRFGWSEISRQGAKFHAKAQRNISRRGAKVQRMSACSFLPYMYPLRLRAFARHTVPRLCEP
jgi:hypothetical protein